MSGWRAKFCWGPVTAVWQMQAENASIKKYRTRQTAGIGHWKIDLTAGCVVWSEGLARVLGREEWACGTISLRRHVISHHPRERARLIRALRRGTYGTLNFADGTFIRRSRMLHSDGSVLEVVVHGWTRHEETNGRVAISGLVIDVSDLVRFGRELQMSEIRLRAVLEHIDQGLIMTDANDRVRVYNKNVVGMLDVPESLLREGSLFADVRNYQSARGEFAHLAQPLRRWLEQGHSDGIIDDYERVRPDGMVLHVRTVLTSEGGTVQTFSDVTQRTTAEAALRESERRFRLLAENSNDIFILGDLELRRLYISPAVRAVLGYEPEELVGSVQLEHVHPEERNVFTELWTKARGEREGRFVASMRYRHKAGHYVWVEASVRVVREPSDDRAIGYVAALRDISERRRAEEQIRYLALHDALTGLPNRALFWDRLSQAIAHGHRTHGFVATLACDLDRFKAVNDSLGHPAGDTLLRLVADRMTAALRPYDTLARLGGDEFAVLLTHLDMPSDAARVAEQLIAAVSQPMTLEGRTVEASISIKLTLTLLADESADKIFKRADIALYEAKAAGGNTYREFDAYVGDRIALRGQLALDMAEAIRRGEFHLSFQPVVDAALGVVISFEALMRWKHCIYGEISPSIFIPLAEETGMIVPLGVWALHEACRIAVNWPDPVTVAVNVSVVQLRRGGLEEAVHSALSASGLPPTRLKLEVTESVLVHDADAVLASLHTIRGRGVRVALDDFGTGYSSLSYLRIFPFDEIKLDRSFVQHIDCADSAAIVRAVVGIGERLGMGVVAEGVETSEQLNLVRQEGCAQVQGFLFSAPMPAHEATLYLAASLTLFDGLH